jgi:hypothetical protein
MSAWFCPLADLASYPYCHFTFYKVITLKKLHFLKIYCQHSTLSGTRILNEYNLDITDDRKLKITYMRWPLLT